LGNNRGFVLEVAYRNKLIVFEPSFGTFRQEMMRVLEMLRDALQYVPRLETALPIEKLPAAIAPLPDNNLFLKVKYASLSDNNGIGRVNFTI
jgi:hypothetical protein